MDQDGIFDWLVLLLWGCMVVVRVVCECSVASVSLQERTSRNSAQVHEKWVWIRVVKFDSNPRSEKSRRKQWAQGPSSPGGKILEKVARTYTHVAIVRMCIGLVLT